jgi:hypothetical protein
VGFTVIIPGEDLDDVVLIALADDCLPALREQMLVTEVGKLGDKIRETQEEKKDYSRSC